MSIKFNPQRSKPGPKPKPANEKVVAVCFTLRPDIVERLDKICAKLNMGKSAAISSMVERYRI